MRIATFCVVLVLGPAAAHAGYTHYFTWHRAPTEDELKACIPRIAEIIAADSHQLAGPDGTVAPEIGATQVAFNGKTPSDHEPFVFPGRMGFNFCKTELKPYDAAVTASLIVARDCFPPEVLEIASDGSWADGDWNPGATLYSRVFHRKPVNPLNRGTGGLSIGSGFEFLRSFVGWLPLLVVGVFLLFFLRRRRKLNR